MQQFLIRHGLYVILMLVMVSIGFVVIDLPPGGRTCRLGSGLETTP